MKAIVVTGLTALLLSPGYARGSTNEPPLEWHDGNSAPSATEPPVSKGAASGSSTQDGGLVLTNKPPGQKPDSTEELLDPATGIMLLTNRPQGSRAPAATRELRDPSTGVVLLTNRTSKNGQIAAGASPSAEIQAPPIEPPPATPPPGFASASPHRPGTGQWVYTTQYGWLFMPYASRYTSEGSGGAGYPQAYVYEPSRGWTWVSAPWVWGWGAYPYFGTAGPWNFAWYRGLYRSGYGWGTYRGGGPSHRQSPTAG